MFTLYFILFYSGHPIDSLRNFTFSYSRNTVCMCVSTTVRVHINSFFLCLKT